MAYILLISGLIGSREPAGAEITRVTEGAERMMVTGNDKVKLNEFGLQTSEASKQQTPSAAIDGGRGQGHLGGVGWSLQSVGKYYLSDFRQGFYNFAMRGRHLDAYSAYKRVASKDHIKAYDREESSGLVNEKGIGNPSWRRFLPYICLWQLFIHSYLATISVVNETLDSISMDLGFSGNPLAKGLVVSTCLGDAFFGSIFSGWILDGVGHRRAFQLCALPMIIGASMR
ncbi:unnamed protein product [Prunus armeniaca]|uniref:Major facilitator superfamily (MFS) profile domain-containing protein n=1 Tax=Prunus armeniaca TaxID=36596 RepID=A0A6J5WVH0_PRUAR|nr:unnamed protein product [Prunus armeniaca]